MGQNISYSNFPAGIAISHPHHLNSIDQLQCVCRVSSSRGGGGGSFFTKQPASTAAPPPRGMGKKKKRGRERARERERERGGGERGEEVYMVVVLPIYM